MLRIMKWFVITMAVVTAALLMTNFATVGILFLAVDALVAGVYTMLKSACDRRQLHKMSMIR
ncbi:hypothetical protein [Lacticaseibacillus saniviri]|uniref:Uncharacterized protein n=3 Tax=cellular organisms TaxID=131567 RepID=A0A0R2MT01_9LACO|nr:hypothetical protein [Lacticaseibacillus saniviri]KRO15474.1 hypothetical protein IV56_GL002238 [Lacticaseibacillus saniviri JCM 17471 = DSM 24301]